MLTPSHRWGAVREEESGMRVKEAEEALAESARKLQLAEERSSMAEAAKIELSLKLAAALSELESTEDVSAMPSRYAHALPRLLPECACPPASLA